VAGQFSAWNADIRFDPANLARSRAVVTITTASARTGQKDPDANLPDKDWFNPKAFPAARFETVAIRSLGGNRFEADSRVTIRGVTVPAVLAFTLTITGSSAQMAGTAMLDRLAFGLGAESDPKAEWVDRQVRVDVTLKATRKP
jgi:cytochrome b561